jgi:hypothetical protein
VTAPPVTSTQATGPQGAGAQVGGSPPVTGRQLPASGQLLAGMSVPWRYIGAATVLAAGQIWWSAAPLSTARGGGRIALIVAIVTATASLGQVAVEATPAPGYDDSSLTGRLAQSAVDLVRMLPWPEAMTVAVLVLEALHQSRPWHTAVLGAPIVGFLMAVHMAESRADGSVLRRQLPLIGIGLGLSALAAGVTALPSLPTGDISSVVRIITATVGVIAVGMGVPVWLSRRR